MTVKNSCRECVFAIRDEEGYQTDCEFGRLEDYTNYNKKGRKIPLDCSDDFGKITFDEESKSYEISERLCNLSRSKYSPWAADTPKEKWAEEAFKDARLRFKIVILVMNETPVETIRKAVEDSWGQNLPPVAVHIVLVNPMVSRAKTVKALDGVAYDGIRRILIENMSIWEIVDEEEKASNISKLNSKYNYVCLIDPEKNFPKDYLESVDYLVNKEMELVPMMSPKTGFHGTVYSRGVREVIGGDYISTMAEKIEAIDGIVWESTCE